MNQSQNIKHITREELQTSLEKNLDELLLGDIDTIYITNNETVEATCIDINEYERLVRNMQHYQKLLGENSV